MWRLIHSCLLLAERCLSRIVHRKHSTTWGLEKAKVYWANQRQRRRDMTTRTPPTTDIGRRDGVLARRPLELTSTCAKSTGWTSASSNAQLQAQQRDRTHRAHEHASGTRTGLCAQRQFSLSRVHARKECRQPRRRLSSLTSQRSIVDDDTEALAKSLLLGHTPRNKQQVAQQRSIVVFGLRELMGTEEEEVTHSAPTRA